MQQTQAVAPGIEISKKELIQMRPPRGATGFAPSGPVQTHQWGTNRSAFLGQGMEFAESRIYQPGDDVKNIDWCVTARTGQAHTKLFQAERERPVYLLLDLRSMMQFGSRVRFKSHLAAEVAAKLAWIGHDGGDRIGALILGRNNIHSFRSARTRGAVLQFLDAVARETRQLELPDEAGLKETSLSDGLRRLRQICRPGSMVFVISDFADLDSACEREMKYLAGRTHIINIQISDPLDSALPATAGRISNGRDTLQLSRLGKKALQDYASAFEYRSQQLKKLSVQHNMVLHQISTPESPACLFSPRAARSQR